MNLTDLKRKLIFGWYTLRPFNMKTIAWQVYGRLLSVLRKDAGFRIIDLAIGYRCNLNCEHCSAIGLDQNEAPLTLSEYTDIVRQAKELGNLSWNITGGEPLMVKWLEQLIPVLEPDRHYISIQTNCMLLTSEKAKTLKKLGVNCITTSLDSPEPSIHNQFRGDPASFERVISGIKNARNAGMQALVGGTVTHENIRSPKLQQLIRLVNKRGAVFLYNLAVPCGNWQGNRDIIITEEDRGFLKQLLKKYPASSTDHEPGRNRIGCPAGMEKIYITPFGEVLPCPFIHISFGNVKKTPLKEIVMKMRRVGQFGSYPEICVAAEDPYFHDTVFPRIEKCRQQGQVASCDEIFPEVFREDTDA